jgi:hypothetical protein
MERRFGEPPGLKFVRDPRRRRLAKANQPRHPRKQRFRMDRTSKGVNMVNLVYLKRNSPHLSFG